MADQLEDTQDIDIYAPPTKEYRFVQFETEDAVARITLNRPPANVLSIDMMDDLNRALEALEFERDVKLVVISGSAKFFSAGFELGDHLGDRAYLMLEGFQRIFENLAKLDKPVLAIVAGSALGAGSLLAAACDITLAGASAKLGHPEIKGGVFNTVGAALLPRLVGRKRAIDLILSGRSLTAAEGERLGLVTRVVPDDKLQAEAEALIGRFKDASAPVLQLVRRAYSVGLELPLGEAIRHAEDVYLNQLMATEDAQEGLRAISERRKPVWKNK